MEQTKRTYQLDELYVTSCDDTTLNGVITTYTRKGYSLLEKRKERDINFLVFFVPHITMEQTTDKPSEGQKQLLMQLLKETNETFKEYFLELAMSKDEEDRRKFIDTRIELSKMVIPSPCDDIDLRKWCIEQCNRGGYPDIPKADELYRYVMCGRTPAEIH